MRLGFLTGAVSAALAAALFISAPAHAQAVQQAGPWASRHAPVYLQGGGSSTPFVQDSGPAGGGPFNSAPGLSEQQLIVPGGGNLAPTANSGTGPFGTNWCDYDAPTSGGTGGYHYLCLSPNAQGGGLLAYGSGGGAAPLPFYISVNGILQQIPVPLTSGGTGNVFPVTQFGAKCDGSTNDQAAIQATITAASASGAATSIVYIPAATCVVIGSLTISTSGVWLQGANSVTSRLLFKNGSGDDIVFAGVVSPCCTYVNNNGIQHLRIDNSNMTGGNSLNIETAFQFRSYDVVINNIWNGLKVSGLSNDIKFDNLVIQAVASGNPTVGAYGVHLTQPPPTSQATQVVSFSNSTVNTNKVGSFAMDCLDVDGWVATIRFDQVNLLNCNYGARFYNPGHDVTGEVPVFIQANDLEADGTVYGVSIESGFHYSFSNSIFDATAGSTSTYPFQVLIDPSNAAWPYGIVASSTKIFNAPGSVAYLDGNDIVMSSDVFTSSNSAGTTRPTVLIGAAARNVTIAGSKIGTETNDTYGGTYSVSVTSGASNIILAADDMSQTLAGTKTGQLGTVNNSAGLAAVSVLGGTDYLGNQTGSVVVDSGTSGNKISYLSNMGTTSLTKSCFQNNTNSANAYFTLCQGDGTTPNTILNLGAGDTGGLTLQSTSASGAPILLSPAANVDLSGTVPVLSSCGTSPSVASGSDGNHGAFTTGTGTPTACTVTFATAYPNQAACTVAPSNAAGAAITGGYYISAQSASAFTVTLGTGTNSVKFSYVCFGN